jgi:hypothetical protein
MAPTGKCIQRSNCVDNVDKFVLESVQVTLNVVIIYVTGLS